MSIPPKVNEFNLSLIIPAYNESKRMGFIHLAMMEFKSKAYCDFDVILIDDGSTDDTKEKLQLLLNRWAELGIYGELISYPENKGKGHALKQGVKRVTKDFFLTLDFDMSTQPTQLIDWRKNMRENFSRDTIYIGDRQDKSSVVKARWYRRFAGAILNLLLPLISNLNIADTQCGFKLYPREIGKSLFSDLVETGWSHDIELLMRAQINKVKIKTMPVNWEHRGGAKVSVLIDGTKMLGQIFRIINRIRREEIENR